MKKNILLSTLLLGTMTLGATNVFAEEVANSIGKSTETTVKITDVETPGDKDPIDPTDPNQAHLLLNSVPSNYNFETTVSNVNYSIDSTDISGTGIVVFNDLSTREWSVKASVANSEVSLSGANTTFAVDSFKVNDVELVATGSTGIVASSVSNDASNTGTITTPVDSVHIKFKDKDGVLKTDNKLVGQIDYVLYNTVDAQ